jgi:hypothetical protein
LVEKIFGLSIKKDWAVAFTFLYMMYKDIHPIVGPDFLISYVQSFFPPERTRKIWEDSAAYRLIFWERY